MLRQRNTGTWERLYIRPATRGANVLIALLLVPAAALAFHVDIVEIIGGRQIEITGTALQSSVLLQIVNREGAPVECEIRLDTGPDDTVRRVRLAPRRTRTLNVPVRSVTQRVRVRALCE